MEFCAGIVLFHPEVDRLRANIEAISSQVDKLYIVNNAPEDFDRLYEMFGDGGSPKSNALHKSNAPPKSAEIIWVNNDSNLGIAVALNQLITAADKDGYEWILTLDQDSVCDEKLAQKLYEASQNYENTAMVSPRVMERGTLWEDGKKTGNTKRGGNTEQGSTKRGGNTEQGNTPNTPKQGNTPDIEDMTFCITSGTLTNIKAVKSVGGFEERLFIDEVDRDICIRLRYQGYRLLRANTAELNHQFGLELVHRKLFFKTYSYRNYSPFRVYYQVRNLVYMVRKYGSDYKTYPAWRLIRPLFTFFVKFIFEPERFARLKAFFKGYAAGLFMKAEKVKPKPKLSQN